MEEKITISDITNQKKKTDRVNVFVNGSFFGSVFVDTCLKYNIKKGSTFTQNELNEIVLSSDKQIALNQTAKYISNRLKTIHEVREYLKKKEYSNVVIDYVIEKLNEYKYLNDDNYIEAYVNTYQNKYGVLKLKNNLLLKGIKKEKIEDYLLNFKSDKDVLSTISDKYFKNKPITYENLSKYYRFLATKGFSYEEINSEIQNLKEKGNVGGN